MEIAIGKIMGPAQTDSKGTTTTNGVGAPKNAKAGKARLVQVRIGPALQTVQLVPWAGEDANPPMGKEHGATVVVINSAQGIKFGIAISDLIDPDINLLGGEKKLYGSDGSGAIGGRIKFKNNTKIFIGNAGGNLRAQLDALADALNTFSGASAQAAITAAAATSISLAAAIVLLLAPLTASVTSMKAALDAVLDTSE